MFAMCYLFLNYKLSNQVDFNQLINRMIYLNHVSKEITYVHDDKLEKIHFSWM